MTGSPGNAGSSSGGQGNAGSSSRSTNNEDEFSSFCYATDKVLINPNTKEGKLLFNAQVKSDIKDDDRLKGRGTESEKFRMLVKTQQAKGNFADILTFTDSNGKNHDLANAPEFTSIDDLVAHNNKVIWGFGSTSASNETIVKLSDKPKGTADEKKALREIIDKRAKNQIIRKYLSNILDPNLYSTITGKVANKNTLLRVDTDNNDDIIIDGTVLLLLVAKLICPSTISLIENLKSEAASLELKDFDHDVSAVVSKFDELAERITSHGRVWDDDVTSLFKVLYTNEDSQFNTAIQIKENEHLGGVPTTVTAISNYAVAIYTNQKAKHAWMVPDSKSLKITALMTQVEQLKKSVAKSAFTTDTKTSQGGGSSFRTSDCPEWRYKHTGEDKITRDGRDWYWCDHPSHKQRENSSTHGMYCVTHGKGHPEHDHASYSKFKKENPFGRKRAKQQHSSKPDSSTSSSTSGVSLNEKLKNALLTRTACTEAELDALSNQDF